MQSEKRKQDLLSEIVLEEQRSRELSKIVTELLPEPKNSVVVDKQSRSGPRRVIVFSFFISRIKDFFLLCSQFNTVRELVCLLLNLTHVLIHQRSKDRSRMSKRLSEEAEKYIEDFISNVEDTDISSLDGERSDTSSSLGGIPKTRISESPAMSMPLPVEMDGVLLPWLKWETSNDASPLPCMNKMEPPITPRSISFYAAQVVVELLNDGNSFLRAIAFSLN